MSWARHFVHLDFRIFENHEKSFFLQNEFFSTFYYQLSCKSYQETGFQNSRITFLKISFCGEMGFLPFGLQHFGLIDAAPNYV
jgi:hypothetical protein